MFGVKLPNPDYPKLFLAAFLLFFLILLSPFSMVSAAIVINEIFYDAEGADDNHEWIEVFNSEGATFDLSGWRFLEASVKHNLTLSAGSFSLSPESFAVIAEDAPTFLSDYPSFSGNLYDSSFSLSNSGEALSLLDGPAGNVIDSVTYSSSWGGGSGLSLERVSAAGASNEVVNWQSGPSKGSPGSANVLPTPTTVPTPTATPAPTSSPTPSPTPTPATYPVGIYLTEFVVNPAEGEEEWVEIYNSNAETVELSGWQIDDKEGGSSPQSFSAILSGRSFYQVVFSSHKLNNDGDSVRLLRPDSSLDDSISYSSSQKGAAWAKDAGGHWQETSLPTPGGENRFAVVGGPTHKNNIAELKKLTLGSKIELEALISVPAGVFSDNDLYAVDDFTGIKISFSEPPLRKGDLGDQIHVSSTIEETNAEKYIKTKSYESWPSGRSIPEPVEIDTGEIIEANEGRLVKVRGRYEGSDGDNFFINDGTGRAKIYLKNSTGIIKPKMAAGETIEVQGVVSQYGHLKDGGPNYRLLPRFQGDLRNLTAAAKLAGTVLGAATELPRTGSGWEWTGVVFVVSGGVLRLMLKFWGEVS